MSFTKIQKVDIWLQGELYQVYLKKNSVGSPELQIDNWQEGLMPLVGWFDEEAKTDICKIGKVAGPQSVVVFRPK